MADRGLPRARLARMGQVMVGYVERGEVPGVVTLVARRGEVDVYAAGMLAADGGTVRRDILFRVTSMTKPLTAAAAAMTSDRLIPAQKAVSGFWPGCFDGRGWEFGLSVVTRRGHLAAPVGTFGGRWLGHHLAFGPRRGHDHDLDEPGRVDVAEPPNICPGFWITACQAIDDRHHCGRTCH